MRRAISCRKKSPWVDRVETSRKCKPNPDGEGKLSEVTRLNEVVLTEDSRVWGGRRDCEFLFEPSTLPLYWVKLCPLKRYVQILTPIPPAVDVTLLRNRIFADVIQIKRDHVGLEWALNPMTSGFMRRGEDTQR